MKSIKLAFLSLFSSLALLSLNSCVSTEVVEPETPDVPNEEVKPLVLNLTVPEDVKTRAVHEGYKLRYIAKLYEGLPTSLVYPIVERKELLAGEEGDGGVKNQIVFYPKEGVYYTIYLFADYIPDPGLGVKGPYNDYFYDTKYNNTSDAVRMLSTPASKNSTKVSADFFNNENYDCFGGMIVMDHKKTEVEDKFDITLERLVSKVRLVDQSGLGGDYIINVTYLDYLSQYILSENYGLPGSYLINYANSSGIDINLKDLKEDQEKEIFYFYTFEGHSSSGMPKFQLTITDSNTKAYVTSVKTEGIDTKRNYITTLKGNVLPGPKVDLPDQDEVETRKGGIVLNLSQSENWNTPDLESTLMSN